jgi:hypothetical protein
LESTKNVHDLIKNAKDTMDALWRDHYHLYKQGLKPNLDDPHMEVDSPSYSASTSTMVEQVLAEYLKTIQMTASLYR